ncbi:MAG: T9SS type A sorting domain-containing protein [Bacteroidetes bacterium]|nr:T9SS type A sorting domain-containing protein [Bacteroidota bacterium]
MKNIFTSLICLFALSLNAQTDVNIHFNHLLGGDDFQLESVFTAQGDYDANITRLEYYISQIELIHDGGQVTPVEDTWLLVDASETNSVYLGNFDVQQLEGMNISIGVEESVNHLDPGAYPADHPLAPQIPPMHWGWAAGYRFVCLEGLTSTNQSLIYQIHALGDDNYFTQEMTADLSAVDGVLDIGLEGEYLNMFINVDVSGGEVVHGDYGVAIKLLQNMTSEVFSVKEPVITTSAKQVYEEELVSFFPNPATETIYLQLENIEAKDMVVSIQDISGKMLIQRTAFDGTQEVSIASLPVGAYIIQVVADGRLVDADKLIINK